MNLWACIEDRAELTPEKPALDRLTYLELKNAILYLYERLPEVKDKKVGLLLENGPLWGIYDIALTLKGAVVVPIPAFFSKVQVSHIISDAELDLIFAQAGQTSFDLAVLAGPEKIVEVTSEPLTAVEPGLSAPADNFDRPGADKVVKITYTSGTTGSPRGVMVRRSAIEAVTNSLAEISGAVDTDCHLSLLPLSTLLENIGGLYLPLTIGASIIYPEEKEGPGTAPYLKEVAKHLYQSGVTTVILVPKLLEALINIVENVGAPPASLRYVALGGAPSTEELLKKAEELRIPVYQGYGLTECTSVVTANSIKEFRVGSVGKVLPHAKVTISEDSEIVVSGGSLMAGYVGKTRTVDITAWPTGDLGRIDSEGYLYFTGRKDNQFKTAEGRKVSPEWVEDAAMRSPAVAQVMVIGEAMKHVSALVVARPDWIARAAATVPEETELKEAYGTPAMAQALLKDIEKASASLPLYARIRSVLIIKEPFSIENGLATPDGKLRRAEILKRYQAGIEKLY